MFIYILIKNFKEISYVPLNIGAIFQHVIAPWLVYWPKLSSRKNNGIPTRNKNIKYGIKNTPLTFIRSKN